MPTRMLAVALIVLVVALAAQAPSDQDETNKRAEQFVKGLGRGGAPSGTPRQAVPPPGLVPEIPPGVEKVLMTPETQQEYQAALREYFGYTKFGISHRKEVFAWQLFSSKVIFFVVLSLVAAGMYFAAVQFQRGLRRKRAPGGEEVTEFAASLAGVRVRSPVLGVLILVISFAFFYLYLQFVYPITTTF